MGLALENIYPKKGVTKCEVEVSLNEITSQLDHLDEKLKNRIDNEIWKLFQVEQQEINKVEKRVANLLEYK